MKEGLIIKYYRERAGLTQTQLGEGICSVTHISKIERGHTQYSSEITHLICKRLNIDLIKELEKFDMLETKLHEWLDAMVKQQKEDIELIKEELAQNPYLHFSETKYFHSILLARYHLMQGEQEKGKSLLDSCQNAWNTLDRFERNLLEHTWSIYFLNLQNCKEAIAHLKNINPKEYNNHEFYFHLATSSHLMNDKVKAYHYGTLALSHFRETNNFKRILDTETVLLIQMGTYDLCQFEETVKQYHTLIKSCRAHKEEAREMNLWHNLAVEYFAKGFYSEASEVYKKLLEQSEVNPNPPLKLSAIRGYVHSCLNLDYYKKQDLRSLLDDGRRLAEQFQNETYQYVFYMLDILLEDKDINDYYLFLENTFLPHLHGLGNSTLITLYEKELFHYYRKSSQHEKASGLAAKYFEPQIH
ncbi:helix-turn-helix protein [Cytobacillus firmus]|uniref:Helix-turn-helix protein n=2 Tax=Cytobacillus TaxID=2675230 RepID=A0A366K605_CYTFI|nr:MULTISPECIES: helix-turn-helix transcriptional regulator [Cytobacillus]RBP96608.1 helix-turn-helix protein [Cytobacillus firmus]TDX45665.1 helix-turn-helix protein [Cytobacillus oceanisediminis]